MKAEELEKLKKILDEQGFEYLIADLSKDQVLMIIESKDPWAGIEFVESKHSTLIYRAQDVELGKDFKPSTEQAYFEQLKKEAFERFGVIKFGDEFEREFTAVRDQRKVFCIGDKGYTADGFSYDKHNDALMYDGHWIYQQYKWATKIERVKITSTHLYGDLLAGNVFTFRLENASLVTKTKEEIENYLKEQLTKYLNERSN